MFDRFTNPIVFPDGWRLVIERYAMQSIYHVELHGIMVPPVQEETVLPETATAEYELSHETLAPAPALTREELRGCVVISGVAARDREEEG
jgi:hypothetical protein